MNRSLLSHRVASLLLLVWLILGGWGVPPVAASAALLQVDGYRLVAQRQVWGDLTEYRYRATLGNLGQALVFAVKANAQSLNPAVRVVDGTLHFVAVPAGGTVASVDNLTLRAAPGFVFSPAALQWRFKAHFAARANAGPDQTVAVGRTVVLDGAGSSGPFALEDEQDDAADTPLRYQWRLLERPAGSRAQLSDARSVQARFMADQPGRYVVSLKVKDHGRWPWPFWSEPDSVTISTVNSAPVADAGLDQSASVNTTVTLDGSGSSDVDGDSLSYTWRLTTKPEASGATLSDAASVKPSLLLDKPGVYTARLKVADAFSGSEPDSVTISTVNSRPAAEAGPAQTVALNAQVLLDGSASHDADGDPLSYAWSLTAKPNGSQAVLDNANAAVCRFSADRPGSYVAQLRVNDGQLPSEPV